MDKPADPTPDGTAAPQPKALIALLALASVVGVVVSLAAWGFLELIHQIQVGLFTDLPEELGYHHGAPSWFSVVVLGLARLLTAGALARLPGGGGPHSGRRAEDRRRPGAAARIARHRPRRLRDDRRRPRARPGGAADRA